VVEGWFVFTGLEGRYRFNDITIEGDRSGVTKYAIENGENPAIYDVTLEETQYSAVAGFAWYNQSFGATLTATAKSPDYKEAPKDIYGTGGLALYAFF
jgi:hypothetical protein